MADQLSAGDTLAPKATSSRALGENTAAFKEKVGEIESRIESKVAESDAIPLPKLEPVPPPKPQSSDPKEVWGSAAMVFAFAASALTRRPLVTAMNAAADVINSYRKADQEAANQAYQTWKVSSENAIKLGNYELETYKAIISKNEHDVNAASAELRAEAAKFQDPVMMQAAADRSIATFERLILERERLMDKMINASGDMELQKKTHDAIEDLKKSPEYQNANSFQQAKMVARVIRETSPKYVGQADRIDAAVKKVGAKLKPEITSFDTAIGELDQAIAMVNQDPRLVGVAGMARRYGWEPVIGNLNPAMKAPAQQFATLITNIQRDIQTLKNKSHYMSKGAIEELDEQIRGLGTFDTPQGTLDSLDQARATLQEQRSGLQDIIDQAGEKAGATDDEGAGGSREDPFGLRN